MKVAGNSKVKNEAKDVIFAFPKPDDWKNIVRDLKLTKIQENDLGITIRHVIADIERYQVVKRSNLSVSLFPSPQWNKPSEKMSFQRALISNIAI
jgi:hypothetical protein